MQWNTVASGVDYVTVTPAIASGSPIIGVAGSTNAGLNLTPAGTGGVSIASGATTGAGLTVTDNAVTTGNVASLTSTSTAGTASSTDAVLNIARSGANANTAHTAYGVYSTVTNTNATSGTNVAGYFSASGATTGNYGLIVANGNVGIGSTTPVAALDVNGIIAADGSSTITSAPPTVNTSYGWKIGLYSNLSAIGETLSTMALRVDTNNWISFFGGANPAANATSAAPDTAATISFNPSAGFGLFSSSIGIGTSGTPRSQISIYTANPQFSITNTGDSTTAGSYIGESWYGMQFGIYNNTGSTWGNVANNTQQNFFGFDRTGKVGSVTNTWSTNFVYRNVLDDGTGNLGIGTSSPTSMVQSYDSAAKTATYTGVLHSVLNTSTTNNINKIGMDIESTGGWTGTGATNTGLVVNALNGTVNYAATFSGGNVGIGTTAPAATLEVSNTTYSTVQITGTAATEHGPRLILNNTGTGGQAWNLISDGGSDGPGAGGLEFYNQTANKTYMLMQSAATLGLGRQA